jgi:ribosomal protein S18 acetylase RimI-like enzyme
MKKFIRFPDTLEDFKVIKRRKAKKDDFDFIYNLKKKTLKPYIKEIWGWDEKWQRKYFSDHFNSKELEIIQFLDKDIGCISLKETDESLEISLIEILPKYQNQGIGTFLIRNIIKESKNKNKSLYIQVLKSNEGALRLYKSLGFMVYDDSPSHYRLRIEIRILSNK